MRMPAIHDSMTTAEIEQCISELEWRLDNAESDGDEERCERIEALIERLYSLPNAPG